MNQFLTLTHVLRGQPCSWTFAYNDVDGRRFLFCRNHSGRVHSFSDAQDLYAEGRSVHTDGVYPLCQRKAVTLARFAGFFSWCTF